MAVRRQWCCNYRLSKLLVSWNLGSQTQVGRTVTWVAGLELKFLFIPVSEDILWHGDAPSCGAWPPDVLSSSHPQARASPSSICPTDAAGNMWPHGSAGLCSCWHLFNIWPASVILWTAYMVMSCRRYLNRPSWAETAGAVAKHVPVLRLSNALTYA